MTTILSPELCCTNIKTSLSFYLNILGFKILYQREEEGFAMIERQGARIMLDEIRYTEVKRIWLSAPIEVPFGRGINLEIKTIEIEDKWYRTGDTEVGQRQFIVLDPDGYMLRFAQVLT